MKFLYVEDIAINAKVLELYVKSIWHIPLSVAPSAEAGIERIKHEKYDLIFMDINLPGMNGVDAVRHIKKTLGQESLPIVMVSADATPKTMEQAYKAGAADYIVKPVKIEILKEKVENLVT